MQLHRLESNISRHQRNNLNENFDRIERSYNKVLDDSTLAKEQSDYAVKTADEALNKSETTQTQLNTIVIEGDSSVEAAQARVDVEDEVHETLKARIDSDVLKINQKIDDNVDEITSHLEQTDDKIESVKSILTVKSRKIRPIATFIDDDAVKAVYTRLYPLFTNKGVPFCTAVISGRLVHNDHMTKAQIKEVENAGNQVMGHSRTHPSSGNGLKAFAGDYAKLTYEIGTGCRDTLIYEGYNPMGFVYPQNSSDATIREITKEYYDYAFGGVGINTSDEVLDAMNIKRIAFGSFTNYNPTINGNSEQNTLAYYKACVDYAIANNAWLVFMTHVSAQTLEADTMLAELIDYIKAANVDILTAEDAYKIHGNRYFAGDVQENKYFVIDKNNKLWTKGGDLDINIPQSWFHSSSASNNEHNITANTPLSNFVDGVTVVRIAAGSGNNFFKTDKDGLLTTYKYNPTSAWQMYKVENDFYFRNVNSSGAWLSWQPLHKASVNTEVRFSTPATNLPLGINFRYVNSAADDKASFPPGFGILVSVKAHDAGYGSYQEYRVRHSNDVYKRYWDDSINAWSEFVLI